MMKAQIRQDGNEVTLQVCGRLAEGWVGELEKCWSAARTNHPGAQFAVDLRGVTFVDSAGKRLLGAMHREGASFIAGGLLIQEVIHQITGNSK